MTPLSVLRKYWEAAEQNEMFQSYLSFVRKLLWPFSSSNEFAHSKSAAPTEDNIKHGAKETRRYPISCHL